MRSKTDPVKVALTTYLASMPQPVLVDTDSWAAELGWHRRATKRRLEAALIAGEVRLIDHLIFTVEVIR